MSEPTEWRVEIRREFRVMATNASGAAAEVSKLEQGGECGALLGVTIAEVERTVKAEGQDVTANTSDSLRSINR